MVNIFSEALKGNESVLSKNNQKQVNYLEKEGKRRTIEEYYNNTIIAYVVNGDIYVYITEDAELDGEDVVFCSLLRLEDIDELYDVISNNSICIDEDEIDDIVNEISEMVFC